MPALPPRFVPANGTITGLFRQPTGRRARALLVGAILAPGARTVASVLRVLGLARERRFCRYHRGLSRAAWSPRAAARVLLGPLVAAFAPAGPLALGLDDIIARRGGTCIAARGLYRDPTRSSPRHFVQASGLRSLLLLLTNCASNCTAPSSARGRASPHATVGASRQPRT